jgi:D-alanyl-lipoteichoic acid acyltransferase DltB (MBOAT superfamily)
MLFNSYIFIFLFFPLAFLGYFGLNHIGKYKAATAFLLIMSLWFCGYTNLFYPVVLSVSIVCNYAVAAVIAQKECKKPWLWAGILLNAGILLFLKYYNFFTENINVMFGTQLPFLELILPLGISFYTFQQISYLVDVYRGGCDRYGLLDYALYIAFFPKLTQGPIALHNDIIPQLQNPEKRRINFENLSRGIYAFALGLAKKVLLADSFAKVVNVGYGNIPELNSPSAALVMVCYSLQIYFDFSGYCDMAWGIGSMLNMELPVNFNSPYKAESVSDFWDRWHMTLTRFFTRYLYIPLGGSRRGKARTYLNTMIVFLVSGLWHGANWTFLLWGALHGIVMVFEKMVNIASVRLPKWFKRGLTFLLVTFGWSLFRADCVSQALSLWQQLIWGGFGPLHRPIVDAFQDLTEISVLYRLGLGGIMSSSPGMAVSLFTFLALLGCFVLKNTREKTARFTLSNKKLLTVIFLMFWSILSLSEISEFLYFNF